MRGRLTDRLLQQGLLTPSMLEELKNEWNQQEKNYNFSSNAKNDARKKFQRNRKK